MIKLGKAMDVIAQGIREHGMHSEKLKSSICITDSIIMYQFSDVEIFLIRAVRLGPKLSETVKGKLSLGARILQVGGVEKVFKQKFNITDDEKLLKASQCYLSTTAGPIAGLLFVSTERVAFCSERSIRITSPTGKLLKAHYKVDHNFSNLTNVQLYFNKRTWKLNWKWNFICRS